MEKQLKHIVRLSAITPLTKKQYTILYSVKDCKRIREIIIISKRNRKVKINKKNKMGNLKKIKTRINKKMINRTSNNHR